MPIQEWLLITYHRAPILDQAKVVGLDPHNNSSHYRDSRLCITTSDPNGQRNQVETLARPPLLLVCTVVTPTGASWALSDPHLEAVHEAARSRSSQRRRHTIKSHTSNRGSLATCRATTVVLVTPASFGPTHSRSHSTHSLPASSAPQ